jgi:hypothetical protein
VQGEWSQAWVSGGGAADDACCITATTDTRSATPYKASLFGIGHSFQEIAYCRVWEPDYAGQAEKWQGTFMSRLVNPCNSRNQPNFLTVDVVYRHQRLVAHVTAA